MEVVLDSQGFLGERQGLRGVQRWVDRGVEGQGVRNRSRRFLKALLGALLLFVPVLLIILLNVNIVSLIHSIL